MKTALVAMILLCGVAARADVEARTLYERAQTAYNLQAFEEALRLFKAAYVHKNDAAFLFDIGQCQRQLGLYDQAARSYRAFLNQGSLDAGQRSSVEGVIRQMDAAAKDARAQTPPTGTMAPPALVTSTSAALHTGQSPPWYKSATGWTLVVGGTVLSFGGMGFFLHSNNADRQIASAMSLAVAQDLSQTRDSDRIAGGVLLGVGGAALLGGAIVLSVRASHHTRGAQ